MMSFFLNPWTMAAGAGLVAAPVLIHLINRMRFRRVKWAAMEFLLKAQKKMRRRKILEQLLLLAMRMLLVFLIGLLFARFTAFQGKETRPTLHVVVLDDTPSMGDAGPGGDAFAEAKKLITDHLLPATAEATTPQRLRLMRLSDQADLANADGAKEPMLIDAASIEQVKGQLGGEKPSTVHVGLTEGLARAREWLDKAPPDTAKIVHVVSDLRAVDWTRDADAIAEAVKTLTDATGAKVHLVDVAAPYRKPDRKTPAHSDNVAIVELKPRNRLVAQNRAVDFEIRIKNFGTTDLKDVEVQFYRNGEGNVIPPLPIATLPANQEVKSVFQVQFPQIATKEDPLGRFNIVTALLNKVGSDALAADNIRHAVVEVKEKLSVLFVVNQDDKPDDSKGDSFFLRELFNLKFAAIDVITGGPEVLEKHDLRAYSTIYLLNVPELKKPQVDKLEQYIAAGGGVGVFLGPKVQVGPYNELAYRNGAGFFPVPLPSTGFTQPPSDEARMARTLTFAKRILARSDAAKMHPAVGGVYTDEQGKPAKDVDLIERSFYLPVVDQHWPIARLGKWREDQSVQEIYCLPNDQPMRTYEGQVVKLIDEIKTQYAEPKFEKYRAAVDPLLTKLREKSSQSIPLTELVSPLDRLLADQVNEGDATEALLREFWAQPELTEVKKKAQALRDSCKYGDPLYLVKQFGRGRVTAMTIPVAAPWTNWPTAKNCWVPVFYEMQKYLSGGGEDENRSVGAALAVPFESGRYKPTAAWVHLTTETPKPGSAPQRLELIREPKAGVDPRTVPLDTKDGALRLNFTETKKPGAYLFTTTWLKRDGDPPSAPAEKPEYFAEAFNLDAEREGNLQRTNADEFKSTAKGAELHSLEDMGWLDVLKQKQSDLSSGRWLYLFILVVLVFEQALAVRLSYHTHPETLEAYAPSAAAVFARGTGSAAAPLESEDAGADLAAAAAEVRD